MEGERYCFTVVKEEQFIFYIALTIPPPKDIKLHQGSKETTHYSFLLSMSSAYLLTVVKIIVIGIHRQKKKKIHPKKAEKKGCVNTKQRYTDLFQYETPEKECLVSSFLH